MDELLTNWDAKARGSRKPHLLYTVPSGQNPTGATQGVERRQAIYRVAQKHDIFILEDEPYYFLQMQPYTGRGQPDVPAPNNVEEFVSSLIPTYVSMDVDGRVMRMDSLSKVLVPGSRLGWIVASEQIVERYQRHAEVASQGPSGFSQVIVHKLLDETWGHEGYLRWLMNLRLEYTKKRDALLAACEDNLPRDLVSWTPPAAGMFVSFLSLSSMPVLDYLMKYLTRVYSCGSVSTTPSTPARAPAAFRKLRRKSSTRASRAAYLSLGDRGSSLKRTVLCRA
jgi:aromatic amino acid aminotransferase I